MKKKVLMAVLLGSACLAAAGCGNGSKEKATEAATEAAAETEAETESEAAETEAKTEAETVGTEAETEAETAETEAETEEAAEAETEGDSSAELETEAETKTEAAEEAETEGESEAQTEGAETETEAGTEGAQEETESQSEGAEAESEAETEAAVELGERPDYQALDYVTLGAYNGLEVTVDPVAQVTEEEIDATIEASVTSGDLYDEVTEGTVQEGDLVNIDYVGTLDGEAFDGGTAEGYDLEIGSGSFIDGFEDGLVGVNVGDTVDLNLTFPENYGSAELAGQDTVFTVTVNSIKVMPQIDDELANTLSGGEYTTMEGYREYIREQLQQSNEQEQETNILIDLMTQLYNTSTIEGYPQELVDYSLTAATLTYESTAQMYGMELEDFLSAYYGMTQDDFNQQMEEYIKQSLQQEMILKAIAEEEGMTVSDEEYTEGCENYRQAQGYETVDDLVADYGEAVIRTSLLIDKAMDYVRETAVVTEAVETESESEAATEAQEAESEAGDGEGETEAETEAVSEAGTEGETEAVSEAAAEGETEAETEAETETVTEAETEA